METKARATAEEGFVPVAGMRFHYRAMGDGGGGPTVLVLHGIMGHAREWDGMIEPLAATYRVIALDQRGHGGTDWADDYSAALMAEDLIGVIERLGLHGPRVVAHSMGGMAALIAAARRPELVERLAVLDVGPDTVSGELAVGLRDFVGTLGSASYDSVDDALAEWTDPLASPQHLRHYVEHCLVTRPDGRFAWSFDGVGLTRFFEASSEELLWDAIDRITCPVLVVRGEHSAALSQETAVEMTRRFRNGRLVEIPDAGHDLGVQQPEALADAVAGFFTE